MIHIIHHYYGDEHLNVGVGADIAIGELSELIASIVGWHGEIQFDTSMPDGMPRKLLDVTALQALGSRAKIGLSEGIEATYESYATDAG